MGVHMNTKQFWAWIDVRQLTSSTAMCITEDHTDSSSLVKNTNVSLTLRYFCSEFRIPCITISCRGSCCMHSASRRPCGRSRSYCPRLRQLNIRFGFAALNCRRSHRPGRVGALRLGTGDRATGGTRRWQDPTRCWSARQVDVGDVTHHNEERTVAAGGCAVIISYAQCVPATELRVTTELQGRTGQTDRRTDRRNDDCTK